MKYRVTIHSPQVYIVDTDEGLYWPEDCDPKTYTAKLWPLMDPDHPDFVGKNLGVLE